MHVGWNASLHAVPKIVAAGIRRNSAWAWMHLRLAHCQTGVVSSRVYTIRFISAVRGLELGHRVCLSLSLSLKKVRATSAEEREGHLSVGVRYCVRATSM